MSGRYAGATNRQIVALTDTPNYLSELAWFDTLGMDPAPQVGWVLNGDGATFSAAPSTPAPVPLTVTPGQAKNALLLAPAADGVSASLYDQVDAYIAGLAGTEGKTMQIWWNNATEFRRDSPRIAAMAAVFGLSDAQTDDLFRLAATII